MLVTETTHALALYKLTAMDGEFHVEDSATTLPFRRRDYSRFKYGCRDAARRFSKPLADMIVDHVGLMIHGDEQVVVTGTPYKEVPNAAGMLAINAQRHMREAGVPTTYTRIYQHRLVEGDYSTLSVEERELRNKSKKRFVDPADFDGRHVVVVDDVRITGSIERSILGLLEEIPVLSVTIVNLVHLDPVAALAQPQLESELNHHSMTGLCDLLGLMNRRDQFMLTTRAVKYILESSKDNLCWLLDRLDDNQVAELYEAIVKDGYDIMQCYYQSFALVSAAYQRGSLA